jgi:hypothetical protein
VNLAVVSNLVDEGNPIDKIARIEAELEDPAKVSEQYRMIIMGLNRRLPRIAAL